MEKKKVSRKVYEYIMYAIGIGLILAGIISGLMPTPVSADTPDTVNVTLSGNSIGVVDDEMFEWQVGTPIPKSVVAAYDQRPKDEYADRYRFKGWYKDSACTTPWIFTEDATESQPADVVEGYIPLYAGWEEIVLPPVPSIVSDITVYTAFSESDTEPFNLAQNEYFADNHIQINLTWKIDETKANDQENYNTALTDTDYEYQWLSIDAENNEASLTTAEPCAGDETRLDIDDITEMQTMKLFCRLTCDDPGDESCSISMDSPIFTVHFLGEDGHACYFDAGDGTGEMDYVLCKEDSNGQIFLPESSFEAAAGTDDEFLGWDVLGGPSERVKSGQKFTADFSLISARAVYGIPEYTVTYHFNGHGPSNDVVINNARKGTALDSVGTPTTGWYRYLCTMEDDYAFAGWYKEAACTNAWDMRTEISGNTELFAKWVSYPALAEDLIFSGEEQALADDSGCATGFFEYALHEMSGDEGTPENIYSPAADDTASLTVPVALYSGNYLVCCKPRTEGSNNYKPLGIVTIDSKPIIEVIDNKTKQEGDEDPQFTYSYIGEIEGFRERVGTITASEDPERKGKYVLRREEGEDPGTYEIDWVYDPLPDEHGLGYNPLWSQLPLYTVSEVRKGTLTITDRPDLKVGLTITGKTSSEKPFDIKLTCNSQTEILSFGALTDTEDLSVLPAQKHFYEAGQQVTLSVNGLDAEHIKFDGWYSDSVCLSTETSYTVTINSDKEVIAKFTGGSIITDVGGFDIVEFDPNGGTGIQGHYLADEDTSFSWDKAPHTFDWWGAQEDTYYVLPNNKFTPPKGMMLDKWMIDGEPYAPGERIKLTKHKTTAVATWKEAVITISGIDAEYPYTGQAIKPIPRITYGDKLLTEGTDYNLTYRNNTKAGKATLLINFNGAYSGAAFRYYEITPIDLSSATADKLYTLSVTKNKGYKEQKLVPKVVLDGKKLKNGTDFECLYEDPAVNAYAAPGTYVITVKGKGNYGGQFTVEELIRDSKTAVNLAKAGIKMTGKVSVYNPVTPVAQTPAYQLKDSKGKVIDPTEYVITYANNVNPGTATVTFTAAEDGRCYGVKKTTFKIKSEKLDLSSDSIDVFVAGSVSYDRSGAKPEVIVTDLRYPGGKILTKGTDFTVSYANNTNVGGKKSPYATVSGKGAGYKGSKRVTFAIVPADISAYTVAVDHVTLKTDNTVKSASVYVYDPSGKALASHEYAISNIRITERLMTGMKYADITVAGKGKYFTGEQTVRYTIKDNPQKISDAKVSFKSSENLTYNSKKAGFKYQNTPARPTAENLTLTIGSKKAGYTTLEYGKDYEIIAYQNNTKVGTAKLVIEGKNKYKGVRTIVFKIIK